MSDMKLRPYYGELLVSPWPLHMDLPPCGYNCAYCFAKLKRARPFRIPDRTVAQWNVWLRTRAGYLRSLIERRAAICVSNTSDPFSPGVHDECRSFMRACVEYGLPLAYQTRGGPAAREWAQSSPRATWYVSVTSDDLALTDKVESVTPSPTARKSFIEFLVSHGHRVIIGINPYIPVWWRDMPAFLRWAESMPPRPGCGGVVGIWTQNIHIGSNFKNEAYSDAWTRVQPVLHYARAPLARHGHGIYPQFTDNFRTTLPVMGGNTEALERVASLWDEASEPYPRGSLYPTIWQWLAGFRVGQPVRFDDFCKLADLTSATQCSQNKCYIGSKSSRGLDAPLRLYTMREVFAAMWDNPNLHVPLWRTSHMAIASDASGNPVKELEHYVGVRTIGSTDWLSPCPQLQEK